MFKGINCQRLGVGPKWPSYKSVLERIAKKPNVPDEHWLSIIRRYVARGDAIPTPSMPVPNRDNITSSHAEWMAVTRMHKILASAPDIPEWRERLAYLMRYYQVGIAQKFYWAYRFDILAKNVGNDRRLRDYSVETATNMLGALAILGWKEAFVYHGYLTHAALNRGYQLVIEYAEEHRRAQAFMLRLFADWVGDVSHQWPAYGNDEPIYEALLANWRTVNPDDLVPCLLAACDRHTWQTGKDTQKNFYDFNQGWHLERVPVEILLILRLREWEGLSNPTLEHPLMSAPYQKLPPAQPIPELDDLMLGVLKRAREDWPDYDEVLSLSALKRTS